MGLSSSRRCGADNGVPAPSNSITGQDGDKDDATEVGSGREPHFAEMLIKREDIKLCS